MKRPILFVACGMMLGITLVTLIIVIAASVLAQSRTRLVSGADIDVSIERLRATETVAPAASGDTADAFLRDREHETEDKLREAYDDVLKVTATNTRVSTLTPSPSPTRTARPTNGGTPTAAQTLQAVASPTDDRGHDDDADATAVPETGGNGGGKGSEDTSALPPTQPAPQPQPTEDRGRDDDGDDHAATPRPRPTEDPNGRDDDDDRAATPRPTRQDEDDHSEQSPPSTPKPDEDHGNDSRGEDNRGNDHADGSRKDDNRSRENGEDKESKP